MKAVMLQRAQHVRAPVAGSRASLRGAALRSAAPRRQRMQQRVAAADAGDDQIGAVYAEALVELAEEQNNLDAVQQDIDALQTLFRENEQLAELLYNPVVDEDKKREVVQDIAKEAGLNQVTVNFVNLLIDKGRLEVAEQIFKAFEEAYCELTDTQVAVLRSAVSLEQEQHFLIAKKLQELTGSKNIKLKPVIDESVIAGFVVEYGSTQFDMSVRGQLDQIAQELEAGQEPGEVDQEAEAEQMAMA